MAPAGHRGDDAALYDTVRAVAMELCPALGHQHPRRQGFDVDAHDVARRRRRQGGHGAAVADRERVRAGARCAARADAAAAYRIAATPLLLWIDLGAGKRRLGGSALAQVYGQLGDAAPDLDDPSRARGVLRDRSRRSPPTAGSSRITTSPTAACSRRSPRWRSRRAAGSTSRSTASAATRSRRCSPRSSAPWSRSHAVDRAAVRAQLDAAGLVAPRDRRACGGRPDPHPRRRRRRFSTNRASTCIAPGRRRRTSCSGCATIPKSSTRSTRASSTPTIRASRRRSRSIRPTTSRHRSSRRARARDRDPARAGRQRPGRDGRGVRPRGLRRVRRAHDRHPRGPPLARRRSAASSRAADSPTATCSAPARAGRSRSCSTRARATTSPRSSRAATRSRSACATAAR